MNKIAIVFFGALNNNARIQRELESLSKKWEIDVYSSNVNEIDESFVLPNVRLIPYKENYTWLNKSFFFNRLFDQLETIINTKANEYCAIICDNYPLMNVGIQLKKRNPKLQLIYDSREIYIETINQFFPRQGYKKLYGYPLIWLNKWYHKRQEKKYIKQMDVNITVCESLKEYFNKEYGVEFLVQRNFPLINHVKKQLDSTATTALEPLVKGTGFKMLYQGNLNPGRGLFYMLEIMKQLPENIQFFILGDGVSFQPLKQQIEKDNLKNVILLKGVPYNQLLKNTQTADLGISLIESLNESKKLSLPNKLFEYMSVGLPFLSNDLPEPRRLVEQYDCGALVNMEDTDAVIQKILELANDKEERDRLGKNGKKAFETELNWDSEFDRLLNAIKQKIEF